MSRPSPETKAAVLADYVAGMSGTTAAIKHGVSTSTAHKWITDAGISRSNGAAKRLRAQQKQDAEFGYLGGSSFDPRMWEVRGGVLRPLFPERRSA